MLFLTCNVCKQEKEIHLFAKRSDRKLGYYRKCKDCNNIRKKNNRKKSSEKYKQTRIEWIKKNPDKVSLAQRKWYYNNREGKIEYKREWARKNPEKRLLTAAKNRAKNKKIECNIDITDIVIPEYCPVLGLKLEHGYGGKGKNGIDTSPTIDRWDSTKGYIKGNVFVISYRANRLKWDSKIEDLEKILIYMKNKPEK